MTNFLEYQYIIKESCGMGGTSAILKITKHSVIIISPLNGMIKGKEITRDGNHYFVYGKSKDRWRAIEKALSNGEQFILNTSFDQIVLLKKQNNALFQKICWVNWFVDEYHLYSQIKYRENSAPFIYSLYHDTKVPFIISTATPTPDFLDIPMSFRDKLKVTEIRYKEPKITNIELKSYNSIYNDVAREIEKDIPTVIFTNEIPLIKKFLNKDTFGDVTQRLTGDKLEIKLSKYQPLTIEEKEMADAGIIDTTKKIFILSTSYLIGFDIPFDCNMFICVDQLNEVERKYIADIIQAFGRCRGKILQANLYYRESAIQPTLQEINEAKASIIKTEENEEWLTNIQNKMEIINTSLTFGKENLIKNLNKNNFQIIKENNLIEIAKKVKTTIKEEIQNVIKQDLEITRNQFNHIVHNIQGDNDDFNGFGERDLLIFSYAIVANITQSPYLMNIPREKKLIIDKIKYFFDVNDMLIDLGDKELNKKYWITEDRERLSDNPTMDLEWYKNLHLYFDGDSSFLQAKQVLDYLYVIKGASDDTLIPQSTLNFMEALSILNNRIRQDYLHGLEFEFRVDIRGLIRTKNRDEFNKYKLNNFKKCFNHTASAIKTATNHINLTDEQKAQLNNKYTGTIKTLKEAKNGNYAAYMSTDYSVAKQKENHKLYNLFLLSYYLAGHTAGFKKTTIDDREYNIITKVTRQLRSIIPYEYFTADIKSAFARFVDIMVGSKICDKVYINLMANRGILRDEAKTLYNSTLNKHFAPRSEIIGVMKDAGYTSEQCEKLVGIVQGEKGSFFKQMTPLEKEAIEKFIEANNIVGATRLHDAVHFPKIGNLSINDFKIKFDTILFEIKSNIEIEEENFEETKNLIWNF